MKNKEINIKRDASGKIIARRNNEHSFWVRKEDFEAGLKFPQFKPVTYGPIIDGFPDLETYNRTKIEENIKKTVIKFDYTKPSLLTRLMLLFVARHTQVFSEVGGDYLMQYKIYRGVIYVLKFDLTPPMHPNCRTDIQFKGGVQHAKN